MLTQPARAEDSDDPYVWLENVTGKKALAWVEDHNAASTQALTGTESFAALNRRLLTILDSNERIPFVSKAGPHFYNFWRDAKNKRGLWRRTSLAEYRKAEPAWETVLDLDKLAEGEGWVWKQVEFLRPSCHRCLISLSRGGADATVVREFDVESKAFVSDGFVLPEAKSRVAWRDLDSIFVASDFGAGSLTDSGYPRVVKEWQRGTPLGDAKQVFAGKSDDVSVGAFRTHTKGHEHDFVRRAITFWTSETMLRRDGKLIKIETPDDAIISPYRDLLFVELRTDWNTGGKTYPAGAVLVTNLEDFLQERRS